MRILIVVSSRHGSTLEIAETIADELRRADLVADVEMAASEPRINEYDAAIVGSGVYMGRWLPEGRRFVEQHAAELRARPVWLFSSGPLGAPDPQPVGDPVDAQSLLQAAGGRGHRVFSGKLDRGDLGLGEKVVVSLVRAPAGDFRDWPTVRAWATEIAAALARAATPG